MIPGIPEVYRLVPNWESYLRFLGPKLKEPCPHPQFFQSQDCLSVVEKANPFSLGSFVFPVSQFLAGRTFVRAFSSFCRWLIRGWKCQEPAVLPQWHDLFSLENLPWCLYCQILFGLFLIVLTSSFLQTHPFFAFFSCTSETNWITKAKLIPLRFSGSSESGEVYIVGMPPDASCKLCFTLASVDRLVGLWAANLRPSRGIWCYSEWPPVSFCPIIPVWSPE